MSGSDFLLELRCEEIPARMQKGARAELEKLFRREMTAAGVDAGEVTVWSTPRRLALIVRDLPNATEAVREEAKGPPVGAPDQAVDGFCRKNGVNRGQLETRDVKGRATFFAVIERPGQAVADLLSQAIPAIIRDFSWPKSMRWGEASISTESPKWVRPLSGIVALFDGAVVPCELGGIASGKTTFGHRFHSSGEVLITSADDYVGKLRAAHVIVDHVEREGIVRDGAKAAAQAAGLKLVEDEGLVVENAGLTEWPVPLLGRFDEEYLDVPPEVIQLTARVNQKYFVCEGAAKDGDGKLANAFVCTANIEAEDPAVVVDGNRKVLAARLADARFFWELDQKKTLLEHAKGLERITFHEKLGTVADKVDRVAKLARWLCEEKIVDGDPDLAEQAARLCKADLVTEMVGEFPDLQGLMGGYYAAKEGLPVEVSEAIRDHYKPVGQGDDVPNAPVTVAVSLADKLDTLLSFFEIEEFPTGSKDPFALRRAALGIIALILENKIVLHTDAVAQKWLGQEDPSRMLSESEIASRKILTSVPPFLRDRLKVQLKQSGILHDRIEASRRWNSRDDGRLDRIVVRASALQEFLETDNGTNLLAGYKRAANILKKEDWSHSDEAAKELSYQPEAEEKALINALDAAAPKAATAIESEDFAAAMAALASLRAPIDAFFEEVTVNDDDPAKREARLNLLARFKNAVHTVADFSRIEG
ncbi:MAG: glycine--tRNA ligase subunit beta [Erythrobacter sp.]